MSEYLKLIESPFNVIENEINQVFYAGASNRRLFALQYVLPNTTVWSIPGGDERNIPDVITIAEEKTSHVENLIRAGALNGLNALPIISEIERQLNEYECDSGIAIISADSRTKTPLMVSSDTGIYDWLSQGKPDRASQVFDCFQGLARAEALGKPSCYSVETATIFKIISPIQKRIQGFDKLIINLKPKAAKWLSSCDGFETYLRTFNKFYGSDLYDKVGHINPTDVSAGISLPVLISLGVIRSIRNVMYDEPGFKQAVKEGIYTVAVGLNTEILEQVNPQAKQRIQQWGWLNDVTERCLNEKSAISRNFN